MGGICKTVLATALARDPSIRLDFDFGVAWLTFGRAKLEGRSLLLREEQRHYRIHDLYVDLLHHLAAPFPVRHAKPVERYRVGCACDWESCPDDAYILRYLRWHLQ
jgi:hypothetical protein